MIAAGIWIALNMLLVVLSNRRTSAWASPDAPRGQGRLQPRPRPTDGQAGPAAGKAIDKGPGRPAAGPAAARPPSALPSREVTGGSPGRRRPLADRARSPAPAPSPTPSP